MSLSFLPWQGFVVFILFLMGIFVYYFLKEKEKILLKVIYAELIVMGFIGIILRLSKDEVIGEKLSVLLYSKTPIISFGFLEVLFITMGIGGFITLKNEPKKQKMVIFGSLYGIICFGFLIYLFLF